MRRTLRQAFVDTLPVMTGYIVLGFGFGIILKSSGYGILLAAVMSLCIYAGAMQYVAIGLFSGGASIITIFFTTVMVNARHLFYGISMLDKYKNEGKRKPYLIFSLTDETYSLVCRDNPAVPFEERSNYFLCVSLLNHVYWVTGSVLGAAVGSLVNFNTEGIDFALTALFLTVFLEQWLSTKRHAPAVIGVGVSLVCLLLFGGDGFLIPAMLVIALLICVIRDKEECKND